MTNNSERQEQSLTQAQVDSLRQGQRLDAIDHKPKHDSSKTEVKLDAVMQEAEGKRGNQEPQTKQKLPLKCIFLSHVQLSQNDALSKPCAQQVQKSNIPLFDHFSPQKLLPLVGTCTHQAPPEAETPPEQMLCNECNASGVSESIQGYKDMRNI